MRLFRRPPEVPTPEQIFQQETHGVFVAAKLAGLGNIDEVNRHQLFRLGGTLSEQEIVKPHNDPSISPNDAYFLNQKAKLMRDGIERGDRASIALGRSFGRLIAAGVLSGAYDFGKEETMQIRGGLITVNDKEVKYDLKSGIVIDLGVGVAGLFSHIGNLQTPQGTGEYSLISAATDAPEVALLEGIADFHGIDSSGFELTGHGMKHMVKRLLKRDGFKPADIVVASRVQAAGPELSHAVLHIHELLRPGGLFIARGPRVDGYDKVKKSIGRNPEMEIDRSTSTSFNRPFQRPDGTRGVEHDLLVVATRK